MADERRRGKSGYDLDADNENLEVVEEGYGKYRRPDEEDPEEQTRRLVQAGKRFKLAIIVLVVVVAGFVYLGVRNTSVPESDRLNEIASLQQASYITATIDTSAVGKIRRRFGDTGMQLSFSDAVITTYLFLRHPVEVWVAVCDPPATADEAISLLLEQTSPNTNPMWTEQLQTQQGTSMVTELRGRGQINYFFRSGGMVAWVSADTTAGAVALSATLGTDLAAWFAQVKAGGGY